MQEELLLSIDAAARSEIIDELGTMNAFYDRLSAVVARSSDNAASLSEVSASEDVATRGGELVAIVTAVSGLIAALSPVVIAWIRSRGYEVEEKIETRKGGTKIRTLRVRHGTGR